jgi:hypothetical protein
MKPCFFYLWFPTNYIDRKKLDCSCLNKRDRKFSYNVTLGRVHLFLPWRLNTYYVFWLSVVCYTAYKARAPFYAVICGLGGSDIFFSHYLISGTTLGKVLLNIKCIFLFLCKLSDKCVILRRLKRGTVINVYRYLFKAPFNLVRF